MKYILRVIESVAYDVEVEAISRSDAEDIALANMGEKVKNTENTIDLMVVETRLVS